MPEAATLTIGSDCVLTDAMGILENMHVLYVNKA